MVYKVCKECEACNNYKVCENGCFGNTKPCEHLSTDAEPDFLYYTVDVDIYQEEYGVLETVQSDLLRTASLEQALKFARKYAKQKENFDFQYLDKKDGDYYMVTIRKYYKEETDEENGDWDDEEAIRVSRPRNRKNKNLMEDYKCR